MPTGLNVPVELLDEISFNFLKQLEENAHPILKVSLQICPLYAIRFSDGQPD